MRAGGRALSAGCKRFRLRRILVITQMALSLVVRSLQKLLVVEPGFRPEGIVEVDLDLWRPPLAASYATGAACLAPGADAPTAR
jgi:hypothetical protein